MAGFRSPISFSLVTGLPPLPPRDLCDSEPRPVTEGSPGGSALPRRSSSAHVAVDIGEMVEPVAAGAALLEVDVDRGLVPFAEPATDVRD